MLVIGLTGNIGSGKSTVSRHLKGLGAEVIDTDQVARDVVGRGSPGLAEIISTFGAGVLNTDGTLDRKKMGALVFNDPAALAKLNQIVHPLIIERTKQIIESYRAMKEQAPPALVVEAPLLIEVNMHPMMDEVWLVKVDRDVQIQRIMARDNLSGEEAVKRIAAQMPQDEKERYAHRVIDNSGAIEDTLRQTGNYWRECLRSDME